ncbi:MAG TPA: hypothetical protein VNZ03_15450 [Terriglobales bacterium]|jgi:hypothetical protein|nr:hypothetical protein [Terriglobales bacterium]
MNKKLSETQAQNSTSTDNLDRLQNSKGSNRDTDGLGTMPSDPFIVGSVEAINGEDGKEVPQFVPTRHELMQLAEYWALERIDHDFYWFAFQQTGSSDWRWGRYISRRLNQLSEILGTQAMKSVWDAAIATFRKQRPKLTDEDWQVLTESNEEEQETWHTKLTEEMEAAQTGDK